MRSRRRRIHHLGARSRSENGVETLQKTLGNLPFPKPEVGGSLFDPKFKETGVFKEFGLEDSSLRFLNMPLSTEVASVEQGIRGA